jgi:cell division protein FtsB
VTPDVHAAEAELRELRATNEQLRRQVTSLSLELAAMSQECRRLHQRLTDRSH